MSKNFCKDCAHYRYEKYEPQCDLIAFADRVTGEFKLCSLARIKNCDGQPPIFVPSGAPENDIKESHSYVDRCFPPNLE